MSTLETGHDYRTTLNLPLSDRDPGAFPQRGALPTREPLWQARWKEMDLYRKSLDRLSPNGDWILHDGPPYSNGNIHLGHALNKIAKDISIRFHMMTGHRAPYVPGWDNHGMPIENAVSRQFREESTVPDRLSLRRACRAYAAEYIALQSAQFQRLGIRGDWDHPYLTMDSEFEASIVEAFGDLASKGFIYRGLKPVMWCCTCETALADAEVEYEQHVSNSIYVRFPVIGDPNSVLPKLDDKIYAIIWTTTPWTIPANVAIVVHPESEYCLVRATKHEDVGLYLIASDLRQQTMNACELTEIELVAKFTGTQLEGIICKHPLFERESPVLLANYVTMDTGTGLVHTAPGHGKEDFETGIRYGLKVLNPVNSSGHYTSEAEGYGDLRFEGYRVIPNIEKKEKDSAANSILIKSLRASGNLLHASRYEHSYPHCWRCHSTLIYRATVQWFMNIDHNEFRTQAIKAIQKVTWYPKESINRITNMVANRPDWCISRQRSWGVGIPVFYCENCNEAILNQDVIKAVAEITRRSNNDAWYELTPEQILPPNFVCPACGSGVEHLRKETDVLDVWFDSGSSQRAVLDSGVWSDLSWPADLYLEGGDQHRGWFNSSLMVSVGTKGEAPYRGVVTNGWTLDEKGEAMHKSKGNVVDPLQIVQSYGADVVRWWAVSQDFMSDTRCGDNLLKQVGDMYRRVRNTFRFMLNNLEGFDLASNGVDRSELEDLDRWALSKLDELVNSCLTAYNNYEFHRVYQAVLNFCSVEMSSFYLDVIKDRLYASGENWKERRAVQTVMHTIASALARLLAPILVHTSEEVWDHLSMPEKSESVHLAQMPETLLSDLETTEIWDKFLPFRDQVNRILEEARQTGAISIPLESCLEIYPDTELVHTLIKLESSLSSLLLVSQVQIHPVTSETMIKARHADGSKCARCWLFRTDVGNNPLHPTLCNRCAEAIQ